MTDNRFKVQGKVKVINGSILTPHNAGLRFVLSINNLSGKTDNHPLYTLFDKKWKRVKEDARGWYVTKTGAYKLGAVNQTQVQSDTTVIHMLCQDENLKVDLVGLEKCLKEVCKMAKFDKASIHVSELLTKEIPEFAALANKNFIEEGVSVYYYQE